MRSLFLGSQPLRQWIIEAGYTEFQEHTSALALDQLLHDMIKSLTRGQYAHLTYEPGLSFLSYHQWSTDLD